MKVGDLVKMKEEPFPGGPYGFGFVWSVSNDLGYNCCVFFPDLVEGYFDGYKYCNKDDLEMISELDIQHDEDEYWKIWGDI